jgi:hypothetical protein
VALSDPERFVILLTTKQLWRSIPLARAQPHSGLDRAVFHGRWDDRTQTHFSRVWRRVRLGAAKLPVVRLSHSATCQKCAATERREQPSVVRDTQLVICNAGIGIAPCPRSRHSFKGFVRTGDDAAGGKHRSCAQVVTRTL